MWAATAPSLWHSGGAAGRSCWWMFFRVAIVQPMSHTSLDQIRDTIVSELEDSGLDIEITTQNANGDGAALNTILSNCKAEGVDLVVPIATSTAQTAKAVYDGTDTPLVFAAVSDPDAAGLTGAGSSWGRRTSPGRRTTGGL